MAHAQLLHVRRQTKTEIKIHWRFQESEIMEDFLSFKTLNTDDELSAAEESEDEISQARDCDDKVGKALKLASMM